MGSESSIFPFTRSRSIIDRLESYVRQRSSQVSESGWAEESLETLRADFEAIVDQMIEAQQRTVKYTDAILASITQCRFRLDTSGRIIEMNQAAVDDFGLPSGDLLDHRIWQRFPTGRSTIFSHEFQRAQREQTPVRFEGIAPWNGRWIETFVTPDPNGLSVHYRDLTSQKQMELRLQSTDQRLKLMKDSIVEGYLAFDKKGRVIDLNPVAEQKILGLPAADLLGKVFWEAVPGALNGEFFAMFQRMLKENQPVHFESKGTGSGLFFEVNAYPRGETFEFYLRDITQQKQAEEEIISTARFPEENPNPVMRIDAEGVLCYANPSSRALQAAYGCKVGQVVCEPLLSMALNALSSGEKRLVDLQVQDRYLTINVVPIRSQAYVNLYGADMTERQQVELALRESRDRLQQVLESITESYFVLDQEWRIVDYNSVAEREFLKKPKTELIGKVFWEEYPAAVGNEFYRQYHIAMQTGQPVHFEAFSGLVPKWYEVHAYPRGGRLEIYLHDINERKQAEQRLIYQANLLENVHDAVIGTDTNLRVTAWNRAAEDLYGWKAEEAIGRPIHEMTGSQLSPEERQRAMQEIEKTGRFEEEIRHRTRGGRELTVLGATLGLRGPDGKINGYVSTNHDITDRKTAEAEGRRLLEDLKTTSTRFTVALKNAPVSVYTLDRNLRFTWVHKPPFNLTGEEMIGRRDDELLPPEEVADLIKLKKQVLETGAGARTELRLSRQGISRVYDITLEPMFDDRGSTSGLTVAWVDITGQRQMEAEVSERQAQIEIQRQILMNREQERLEIARDLHDGPLQEMIGLSFAMNEMVEISKKEVRMAHIRRIQETLQNQIRDIRSFCNELRPPALAPFGLEKAIRSHADALNEKYPGLTLHLRLARDGKELPEDVRMALFRVYQEGINNVVKHSGASEAWVGFSFDEESIMLEVRDNGKGFQVPKQWVKLAREGHLGLVGMHERVEGLGGRVEFEAFPEKGTRIRVTIPRKHVTAQ